MTHQKNDQQDEPENGLELESYDFSVELDLELMGIESEETQEEEPPKEILDLLKRHEGIEHSSEVAEKLNLGTAEDTKEVKIGTALSPEQRLAMISFLHSYKDVFAWSYQDMPGLDTDLVVHRLPLYPDAKPVKQKLRRMRPEWSEKIKEEVMKLRILGRINIPGMVSKHCPCTEERWESQNVHRFPQPQQGKPKGRFPAAAHRCSRRSHRKPRDALYYGLFFGLQSDQDGRGGQGKDGVHHTSWHILLQSHAIRT